MANSLSCKTKVEHEKTRPPNSQDTEIEAQQVEKPFLDEPVQVYPLGEGAGLIGISKRIEQNNEQIDDSNEGFKLVEDEQLMKIIVVAMIGAIGIRAGSDILQSQTVKGLRIEAGIGELDYATRKAHFQKKAVSNMNKIQKDDSYSFTEIKFDSNILRSKLQRYRGNSRGANDGKIFLGILPDKKIIDQVKSASGSQRELSVLSVVENFELRSPFQYKVRNRDGSIEIKQFKAFTKENIDGAWAHIRSPDYRPVPGGLIDQGADFIHSQISRGRNVFVHCKSGKGRSATMVAAYLIKYRNLSADEAITLVHSQRRHVSIAKTGLFGGHNRALKKYEAEFKQGEFYQ
ncbi:MAG: dual specificity protein phosphatase family protein [Oligoflexales bacterium]